LSFRKRRALIMFEPAPRDIAASLRPCGVRLPDKETIPDDGSQTVDE
jgi:hypothetical protein